MSPSTFALRKPALTSVLALSALFGSAPAVATAAPDSTSVYLSTLKNHHVAYSDQAHIVSIGTTFCHELRDNLVSPQEGVSRIQNLGYPPDQANVIAADAVLSFCPDMDADAK